MNAAGGRGQRAPSRFFAVSPEKARRAVRLDDQQTKSTSVAAASTGGRVVDRMVGRNQLAEQRANLGERQHEIHDAGIDR